MSNNRLVDRMPPLHPSSLNEKQRKVVEEMTNGPRGGVKGPFIPLLRSPDLVDRLGKVGEYLRFGSSLQPRISEFVMLIVAREWTNQFEWAVHAPLALKNGIEQQIVDALAEGRRPKGMADDEEIAYEVCEELSRTKSLCDTTYRRAVESFGEAGVIDIAATYGYFVTVCAIMNLAHTPPPGDTRVAPILPFPS
ncbi:MAG: carboxymuconolactone decarboxylase family protein [Burkholderiales bacterium]